ncbi:plasmid mobilization relaxosome protein MobC [Acinetobacter nectaris]|uniref:plasmid mobilization relaxosome protein MobC n=1 Tax=Acinetobacter nectaris TaxID=1219382 RepID=UPI001F3A857F|nr:plasmid mobilization relaxosome protein MobC [Acinetobacter nectaris]MCF9047181.1 MobC family plasmid mobilization relaxosome protein [Acinetobacter nectaris]
MTDKVIVQKRNRKIRERSFKVRLSESEYQLLDTYNPYGSIAKLLRETALEKTKQISNSKNKDTVASKTISHIEPSYTKTEKELILQLARIGNNVNQIAKAVNTDIARVGLFDKTKLLHLLISIDRQLQELRPDDC